MDEKNSLVKFLNENEWMEHLFL